MLHGYHMAHITLHIAGLTLAIFITTLAASAHNRTKSRRMMISFWHSVVLRLPRLYC